MSIQESAFLVGILSNALPVLAVYLRSRSRLLGFATGLMALTVSVHLGILFRLVQLGPENTPNFWVYALMASAIPVLLAGHLLSATIGRSRLRESLRRSRLSFILLGSFGLVALLFVRDSSFVAGYDWAGGRGTIHLGSLGKAYLSYMLAGMVVIGNNLESTYRVAPSNIRHHLRLPFLAFFGVLGFCLFVIATGILYSDLGLGKLVAGTLPIAFANILIAYGFLRGGLSDVAAPVSRNVVYSSMTVLAAGLYVLVIGITAQFATLADWSPDEVVILSLGFLAIILAALFLFSNRFQRRVRRFIDKNFYVNRYDYRTQWANVTGTLGATHKKSEILRSIADMLTDIFLADEVTIAVRDPEGFTIRPRVGKGSLNPEVVLDQDDPLYRKLIKERASLLLTRRPDDFEYIPIYAENKPWLDSTANQLIGPLLDVDGLMGLVSVERAHKDDPFTFEDVALLDSITAHVAAALQSVQLTQELAESREMELMSGWSNMVLHDLKNYLSPLRMIAQNVASNRAKPEVADIVSRDITRVADRMEALVRTLSEFKGAGSFQKEAVDVDDLIMCTVDALQIEAHPSLDLKLDLQARSGVIGDPSMLKRVLENLITNSMQAMNGEGSLTIKTETSQPGANASFLLSVEDTGKGMPTDFLRDGLFKPFVTTKKGGLGLGLYQCRAIVRAHGGHLKIRSAPEQGTTVQVHLTAAPMVTPEIREREGVVPAENRALS